MKQTQRRLAPYPPVSRTRQPATPQAALGGAWELAIFGDLTEKQADLIGRLLEVPRRSRGLIYFDSCGGSAYVGLSLASLIRLRGLDVTGIVAGECSSAAILPFAACSARYVTRHSSMLFHPIRWQSDENVRMEEAEEWARHFRVMEDDMDELLSRLLDYPREKLDKWTRPGRFVGGEEIVAAGLAKMIDLFGGDVWRQMQSR
jgi:ATP-dependent Clp protease, protease subunit